MPEEFHRIRRLPPYVFAEVNAAKAKARAIGEDIIDLGMGNPDSPTPPHIVAKLIETVQDPRSHRYSTSKGIPGLRRALAGYYQPHLGSLEFSKQLLARARVAVAPGIGFGEHGDGHVRIALVENTHRLRQALRNVRMFLQQDNAGPAEADLTVAAQ